MTGLLLAVLLNLSPGIQLADNVSARHVALSQARLPLVFVSDEDVRPSIDAMSREQLAVELRRLEENKPSLVGPIVLLSVGGALAIPGVYILLTGLSSLGYYSSGFEAFLAVVFVGVGVAFLTAGVILAIVGGIKLATRLVGRGKHLEEVEEVRKRIDALDQTIPVPPPPPELVPPPPPPPPQANLVIPGAMRTVMTF